MRIRDAAFVAICPVAVFVLLRVRPMAPLDMIDPSFYSAYAQHGRDLMDRFGPDNYYWVRLGFVVPASICDDLFGHVAGFFVLRYLFAVLAAASTYILFLRARSRGAAVVATLVVTTCPVLLSAWGTDYPDSAATAYLVAGLAALAMPSSRRRTWWVAAAGIWFTLAIHSQVIAVLLVVPTVAVHLVLSAVRSRRDALRDAGVLAAMAVLVTVGLAAVGRVWLLNADIIGPTRRGLDAVGGQSSRWHTAGLGWMTHVAYLLVPPAILGTWWLTRWRPSGAADADISTERFVGLVATVQYAVFFLFQAVGRQWTLEYHLYSSMLWPALMLCAGFVVAAPVEAGVPLSWRALPVAAVVAAPFLAGLIRVPRMGWFPVGLLLFACPLVAALVVRRWAAAAPLAAGILVFAVMALTVAPVELYDRRESALPQGKYHLVFDRAGSEPVDRYRVSAAVPDFVGRTPSGPLLVWWDRAEPGLLHPAAAQYLWNVNSLVGSLPRLAPGDVRYIRKRAVHRLVLLGTANDDQVAPARRALSAAGCQPALVDRTVLRSGSIAIAVAVVDPGCTDR